MITRRRTKILATLGPATDAPGVLDRLVEAGMDCARVNCSHGGAEDLLRRAQAVRDASERSGKALGLLFDLQGPKLRLSGETAQRDLEVGDTLTFTGNGDAAAATTTSRSTSRASPGCARPSRRS